MKNIKITLIAFCLIAFAAGCSKLKEENPTQAGARIGVHPTGFATPASPDFHGKLLAANNWDLTACAECHGADFKGGTSGQSCFDCHLVHPKGLASASSPNFHVNLIKANNWKTDQCVTCHGADFKGGNTGKSCVECHFVHTTGSADPSAANFHGKAIMAINYDLNQCKFCHGSDYSGGVSQKSCLPCHTQTNGPEYCATCHGSSTSIAPPKDLSGNISPTAPGVGAHQAHLIGGVLGVKVRCSGCHVFPSSFSDPVHINATPGAQVRFDSTTSIAFTKSNVAGTANYTSTLPTVAPNPSFTLANNKCSSTYCHGNFKNGNTANAPAWNDTSAAACGTCHGDVTKATLADRALPKTTLNGGTHPAVTFCSGCHTGVVDANLNIIDPTKHMNGKLNVFGAEQNF
jgi:predicted CxxxxCH...CXXCH cytochrome family protein